MESARNMLREAVKLQEIEVQKLQEENSELNKGMTFLNSFVFIFCVFTVTRNRKKIT